jgi:phytoene dehydrogenase-like protein
MGEAMPCGLRGLTRRAARRFGALARETTAAYMNRRFADPRLRAVLTSQWANYGLPPESSAFGLHATIVRHYVRGGWYPAGGARSIARGIVPVIEKAGGIVLTSRRVTAIRVERGRAVGVVAVNPARPGDPPSTCDAPVVVSDAGAANTYLRLLPPDTPLPFRDALRDVEHGPTGIVVYFGLRASAREIGIDGENHWIFPSFDHGAHVLREADGPFSCYLSFPSLKNSAATAHTAEALIIVDYALVARWKETSWKHRGGEYEALKADIARRVVDQIDARIAGFRRLVEFVEVSTPLSIERFQGSPGGAMYGLAGTPDRIGRPWAASRTPVKNLYLAGCDAFSVGVAGAALGGVKTAAILGGPLGLVRIMRAFRA